MCKWSFRRCLHRRWHENYIPYCDVRNTRIANMSEMTSPAVVTTGPAALVDPSTYDGNRQTGKVERSSIEARDSPPRHWAHKIKESLHFCQIRGPHHLSLVDSDPGGEDVQACRALIKKALSNHDGSLRCGLHFEHRVLLCHWMSINGTITRQPGCNCSN